MTSGERVGTALVETSDLDELVEQVNALMSPHTVTPGRTGDFTASVKGFQRPGLSVFRTNYGMPVRLRAAPLTDYLAVCIPLRGSMAVRHKGMSFTVDARRTGFVGTPDDELVMDWDDDLELLVMRVELSELRTLAARMLTAEDPGPERLQFDPLMDSPAATAAVISQATLLEQLLEVAEAGAVNPLAEAHLRDAVMGTLLLAHANTWRQMLTTRRPAPAARSRVHQAADLMAARAGDPLSVGHLAREVGLSTRALYDGFVREFDASPKRYLTDLRLERAHRELSAAGPGLRVIDVADRWGFTNAGRFAALYRERYGQPPGTTLTTGSRRTGERAAPSQPDGGGAPGVSSQRRRIGPRGMAPPSDQANPGPRRVCAGDRPKREP
ncbi:MAG TPA: AraC family transcriptional regulator [Actinomycetospora sp.]|jgi:AraC-like DNA-binding protein|uniref:AraC family transcriptional regulator n=1 Tax=Actinomycetospora sp. TaxID=1872135 RepID=UPI002F41425E